MNPMILVLLGAAGIGLWYFSTQRNIAPGISPTPAPVPIGVAGGSFATTGTYTMFYDWLTQHSGASLNNQMQALAAITHFNEPLAWEMLQWAMGYAVTGRPPYETEWLYRMRQIGAQHGWSEES